MVAGMQPGPAAAVVRAGHPAALAGEERAEHHSPGPGRRRRGDLEQLAQVRPRTPQTHSHAEPPFCRAAIAYQPSVASA